MKSKRTIISICLALLLVMAFSGSALASEGIAAEEVNFVPPDSSGKVDILTGDVSVKGDYAPTTYTALPYNYSAKFYEYVYTNHYWSPGADGEFHLSISATVSSSCYLTFKVYEVDEGCVITEPLGSGTSFNTTYRIYNLDPDEYYFVKFEKSNPSYRMTISGTAYN